MAQLRYPKSIGRDGQDYITFKPVPYRANQAKPTGSSNDDAFNSRFFGPDQVGSDGRSRTPSSSGYGGHTKGAAAPPLSDAKSVILYMPNSTPAVGNTNAWNDSGQTFQGPFGGFKKALGSDGAAAVMNLAGGDGGGGLARQAANFDVGKVGGSIANRLKEGVKASPSMLGQVAMTAGASALGTTANSLLAISRGQVYNPNVELLYSAPGMRTFGFDFRFIPKDFEEADIVNQIILNFKMWSSPAENSSMFDVPHVWEIAYKTGNAENKYMNRFKKAALKAVTVQANPQTDMHVAHPQGVPIETAISLSFMEVDIITRQDHYSVGGQGY